MASRESQTDLKSQDDGDFLHGSVSSNTFFLSPTPFLRLLGNLDLEGSGFLPVVGVVSIVTCTLWMFFRKV